MHYKFSTIIIIFILRGPEFEFGSRPRQSQDRHWEVFEPPVRAGQVPLQWAPVKGMFT
jgi:hypothetical protein